MTPVPSGTVTFLFTDIEDSTGIARAHPAAWETLRARQSEPWSPAAIRVRIGPPAGEARAWLTAMQ